MNKKLFSEFKTARECAEEWGISQRRVQIYCAEGRIERAFKYGQMWLIPRDAQKPPEKERKRGI